MDRKRLVILGATGQIGRIISNNLLNDPDLHLILQSRSERPGYHKWNPDEGTAGLTQLLENSDVVLNLIGKIPSPGVTKHDFQRVNVKLAVKILETARRAGVPKIFMTSTAAVYGRPISPEKPFKENSILSPLSEYGKSKVAMEKELGKISGADLSTLRIGNVAGADALLGQFVDMRQIKEITLDRFQDGKGPNRSYIGPKRLSETIKRLAISLNEIPTCLNVTSWPPTAMEDMLISLDQRRPGSIRQKWRAADSSAIQNVSLSHELLLDTLGDAIPPVNSDDIITEFLAQKWD